MLELVISLFVYLGYSVLIHPQNFEKLFLFLLEYEVNFPG